MVTRKSWEEFRESELFWFINSILHVFGWAIAIQIDNDNKVTDVYPSRVQFRGFDEKSNTRGYRKVTEYLKNNIDELIEEAREE